MFLTPINEAEAVIEPFFAGDQAPDGSRLDVLAPYRVQWARGARGTVSPTAAITINGAEPDGPALVLERRCDLPVHGYDRLIVFASLSHNLTLRVTGIVDGKHQVFLGNARGRDTYEEYSGPMRGKRLSSLRLEFAVCENRPCTAQLNWIGMANRAALRRMEARRPVYDPTWPGRLARRAVAPRTPQLGLLFDQRPPRDGPVMAALRQRARELMRIDPEAQIGRFLPGPDRRFTRVRDLHRQWLGADVSDVLAFVGWVDDNPAMSRHAARMALSLAQCEVWTSGFMGAFPGFTAHPRCFQESFTLRALPLVLDWAGHWLTPYGREVIRDAMILKGLARVESDFARWEYIRGMNQGIMFSIGRILAYLALVPTYPRYRARLAEAERDLHEMIRAYIKPDGGTLEGMGYWHIIGDVLPVLVALARYHRVPFADYVPARLHQTGDFAVAMLSTVGDGTYFLPVNAARRPRVTLRIARGFAALTRRREWCELAARLPAEPDYCSLLFEVPTVPTARAEGCASRRAAAGVLRVFRQTGQASICRAGVLFHLCSGPSSGGHSHQDKGSFILEAHGEILALDRGTTDYANPEHKWMATAAYHNLLVPETADGVPLEQQPQTTAGGRLLAARLVRGVARIASDNTEAWPKGLFRRNVRRVVSPAPGEFLIKDEIWLARPLVLGWRLQTNHPITATPAGWRVRGKRASLLIEPVNWRPVSVIIEQRGVDHTGTVVNMLVLRTAPTRRQCLHTRLLVERNIQPMR